MKIAILDDYLRLSQSVADWSNLAKTCDITVFDRPLALPDEAARVLQPFDVIVENIAAFLQGKPIRLLSAERNSVLLAG